MTFTQTYLSVIKAACDISVQGPRASNDVDRQEKLHHRHQLCQLSTPCNAPMPHSIAWTISAGIPRCFLELSIWTPSTGGMMFSSVQLAQAAICQ